MLEKGPFIVAFGGKKLMEHKDLQNTSSEKMIPYSLVFVWFCLCQAILFMVKKWKLKKLDGYSSVLQR